MAKRAAFIVIEGLDRSGKSTQVALLRDLLEASEKPVKVLKFPDRSTTTGKLIDSYLTSQSDLDDRAIHLLFSANRWELASSIEALLVRGTTVLCDRYAFSGVAFSVSKGLSYEWCRAPEIGLPAPDLTLFLDISPERAREREGYGQERYETEPMQHRVSAVFQRIGNQINGDDDSAPKKWVHIDAGSQRDAVTQMLWAQVEPLTNGVDLPVQRLWMQTDV